VRYLYLLIFSYQPQFSSQARLNLRPETLVEHKTGADTYCSAPKSKEKVIFPENVVGRAPMNFESYSGYVNVTSEDWLFYWFFENADGNPDAPLVPFKLIFI
jgi:carboxypeptidase C (cathepsin A)